MNCKPAYGKRLAANLKMESQIIWIPKERVAVLIGTNGKDRRAIEKLGGVRLRISEDGEVAISSGEVFNVWQAQKVVEAIGRGFSPENAKKLFDPDYTFDLVDIRDFTGESKKRQKVVRGRVIGTSGSIRAEIEKVANVNISIYGKTVGIIGKTEDILQAKQAIEDILAGARQGTAIGFLKRSKKDSKI